MTDEQLAEIKSRVLRFTPAADLHASVAVTAQLTAMTFDARDLLAEVERLRAIVRAVAEMEPVREENSEYCPFFCGASRVELFEYHDDLSITSHWEPPTLEHTADCPVTKARAVLGDTEETTQP